MSSYNDFLRDMFKHENKNTIYGQSHTSGRNTAKTTDTSSLGKLVSNALAATEGLAGARAKYASFESGNGMSPFGSLMNKWTGAGLTGAQVAQNSFQEYMSNTSYQRQVQDMQAAGVNPALAMNGSANGASTPSGADAGSNGIGFGELISALMLPLQMAEKAAMIENIESNTKNIDVNTDKTKTETDFFKSTWEVRKQQMIENVNSTIASTNNKEADSALKKAQASLAAANESQINALLPYQQALYQAQTDAQKAKASYDLAMAAIQQGLLEAGYVNKMIAKMDAEVKELKSRASLNAHQAKLFDEQVKLVHANMERALAEAINVQQSTRESASREDLNKTKLSIFEGTFFDTNSGDDFQDALGSIGNEFLRIVSGTTSAAGNIFSGILK